MATRETQALIRAASRGDVESQLKLGRMYLTGSKGLAPNQSVALLWLTRARKGGRKEAALEIAENICTPLPGARVFNDYVEACTEALKAGSLAGEYRLGEVHSQSGDAAAAIECFRRAAEAGHAAAARKLGKH